VKAEWEATMIPTNCRTERAPLAAEMTHVVHSRGSPQKSASLSRLRPAHVQTVADCTELRN